TAVVLPAPGGARSTTLRPRSSASRMAGSTASIGSTLMTDRFYQKRGTAKEEDASPDSKTPPLRGSGGVITTMGGRHPREGGRPLGSDDLDRRRFAALLGRDDGHADRLFRLQRGDLRALQGVGMDEDVLAAVRCCDEAEALLDGVPFHGAFHLGRLAHRRVAV